MTEITLQTLIDKVKEDLFAPYEGTELATGKHFPIFFVEQVELEIAVNFALGGEGGIKVSIIPEILEVEGKAGGEKASGHTMKITLTNLFTREELRAMLPNIVLEGSRQASLGSLKGSSKPRPGDE